METLSRILNTTVPSVTEGPGLTALEIGIAVLVLLAGFWLARRTERKLSQKLEGRKVEVGTMLGTVESMNTRYTRVRRIDGVRSALRFEIAEAFKANDVVIAFPQRDVHIDGSLKLEK